MTAYSMPHIVLTDGRPASTANRTTSTSLRRISAASEQVAAPDKHKCVLREKSSQAASASSQSRRDADVNALESLVATQLAAASIANKFAHLSNHSLVGRTGGHNAV